MTLHFEDMTVGRVFELGSTAVTEGEIVDFASRFDPQPFHIDPAAATDTIYGGIIASGWHSCSMLMRLMVDGMIGDSSSMGSPGMDEVRWPAPVRPGDTLTGTATIVGARRSASKPDRGIVEILNELRNQDDVVVVSMRGTGFYACRDA